MQYLGLAAEEITNTEKEGENILLSNPALEEERQIFW